MIKIIDVHPFIEVALGGTVRQGCRSRNNGVINGPRYAGAIICPTGQTGVSPTGSDEDLLQAAMLRIHGEVDGP